MTHKTPRRPGFFDYYEELIGTWTRRLRNRQQAQDLTHDTFVRVLESKSEAVEQPRAYLHQMARNIAIDGFRREELRDAKEKAGVPPSSSETGDPEQYMRAIELAESVERALQELPLNCRKVFVWQKLEGLSQAEIAERLGLSKNMVEKYMIRTLRHLRERVEAP
ncbi:sigma-70 family RNA polymerase sigma factor [Pseudomonas sp.]|uniref:sigma-70 family RNA polymerase sigma factor n=1 Tax=Pseudomonas sp. TaxID=306 RepID=UPI002634F92E|nr:sigma-70 family RNA polymerase sigma factor [Pseudomonas sp.]